MTNTTVVRKPFHKAIVDQIHLVASFNGSLELIGLILDGTIIPEGHDEVIEAWKTRCSRTNPPPAEWKEVLEGLITHKHEMEEAKKAKKNPLFDR